MCAFKMTMASYCHYFLRVEVRDMGPCQAKWVKGWNKGPSQCIGGHRRPSRDWKYCDLQARMLSRERESTEDKDSGKGSLSGHLHLHRSKRASAVLRNSDVGKLICKRPWAPSSLGK